VILPAGAAAFAPSEATCSHDGDFRDRFQRRIVAKGNFLIMVGQRRKPSVDPSRNTKTIATDGHSAPTATACARNGRLRRNQSNPVAVFTLAAMPAPPPLRGSRRLSRRTSTCQRHSPWTSWVVNARSTPRQPTNWITRSPTAGQLHFELAGFLGELAGSYVHGANGATSGTLFRSIRKTGDTKTSCTATDGSHSVTNWRLAEPRGLGCVPAQ
jgi:hypothetical protein